MNRPNDNITLMSIIIAYMIILLLAIIVKCTGAINKVEEDGITTQTNVVVHVDKQLYDLGYRACLLDVIQAMIEAKGDTEKIGKFILMKSKEVK